VPIGVEQEEKERDVSYERLRRRREQKGWRIEDLERRTGVRSRLLELIDRGQFAELPAGLYGRSAVRAYAEAVGLSAEEVLEEVAELMPAVEDPLDGLARVRGLKRSPARQTPELPSSAPASQEPATTGGGVRWQPLAAAGVDATLLVAIDLALVWLTAITCGTSIEMVPRIALVPIGLLSVLFAALYFVLLGGVRNATVGARVAGIAEPDTQSGALDVHDVVARAWRSAVRETSIVDWAHRSGAQRA
jgi:transcriptional regulator with XRE-family HTH domain